MIFFQGQEKTHIKFNLLILLRLFVFYYEAYEQKLSTESVYIFVNSLYTLLYNKLQAPSFVFIHMTYR